MPNREDGVANLNEVFRDYDIRGRVGDEIDDAFAHSLGRSFGEIVQNDQGKSVIVGYDARLSSPTLAEATRQGLGDAGLEVVDIGCVTTPALYFADTMLAADAAIMVTGSHNPAHHNGFKLVKAHIPYSGDSIRTLGDRMKTNYASASVTKHNANTSVPHDIGCAYLQALLAHTSLPGSASAVWDPGNGASAGIVGDLIQHLAGRHQIINGEIDGRFPGHHPDPTIEANLSDIKDAVIKGHYDIGFAFDGDGDRLVVIDKSGRSLASDRILALLAAPFLKANPNATIASDIKASNVFCNEVRRLGGTPILSKTGHTNIKKLMLQNDIRLAGDITGHFFFGKPWIGADDAHLAALHVLSLCYAANTDIATLYDSLPQSFVTSELRLPVRASERQQIISRVHAIIAKDDTFDIDTTDGIRASNDDGWWLLRSSNTENMIVCRVESQSLAGFSFLKACLKDCLEDAGIASNRLPSDLLQ